jgi:Tfp pilus assembly protein PilF
MASIVEKYEQILAADPRSRIFVELARALLDRGDAARTVQICERGLEHHPSSILGRVIWGRALLELSELKGAMDQFEIAIALEPANPYAFNLVGEALLQKDHPREALPALARAAELQPADHRVQALLDEAMRRAREAPPAQEPPAAAPPADQQVAAEPPAPAPEPTGETTGSEGRATPSERASPPPPPTPSAPPPLPKPPPIQRPPRPPSALDFLPGGRDDHHNPRPGRRDSTPTPADAARIAQQYERELREKAKREVEKEKPSFWHRNRFTALFVALGLIGAAAAGVFFFVRERNAAADALLAADRARAGLARDTHAALSHALDVLLAARKRSSSDPEVASLMAQVAAVLAVEHEDAKARELLAELVDDEGAGDGRLAARWALAPSRAERAIAEGAILAVSPSGPPLLQAIAGRTLVERGELEAGRGRLEIAAKATPPMLRAVVDLGDLALAAGDFEGALASYGQAIAAHPTHPRAVAGAAEARLALGRDLELSRSELAAVDADAGSAPPAKERLRYEIAAARVLAATGDGAAAGDRLKKAAATLGKSVRLSMALTEIYLSNRAWDRAEAEAKRVVELAPKELDGRVLLARARNGRRDFAGALASTENVDTRPAHLQRAIARLERGEIDKARQELEKTQREGKLTSEGAVWYALTDLALKRTDKAASLLEKLTSAGSPPALAFVALGRVRIAEGKPAEAEKAFRAAVARDGALPEAQSALGQQLLAAGRGAEAVEPLSRAVALDGFRAGDRIALAEARVAAGEPERARADLDLVLTARPKDPDALRVLASAWLAGKSYGEARRAAERAAAAAPKDPRPLLIGARAALQIGERGEARKLSERAAKLAPPGAAADEARKLAAEASGRKR